MEKLWKIIRHNQSTVIGICLCIIAVCWAYGCTSQVVSHLDPPRKVSRLELQAEADMVQAQFEAKFESLDLQDKFKAAFFNMAIEYSKGGVINPIAFAITLGNILGLSAIIDNRRKDVRIKTYKNNESTSKIPTTNNN